MMRVEPAAGLSLSQRRRQLRRHRRLRAVREWGSLAIVGLAGLGLAVLAAAALVAR